MKQFSNPAGRSPTPESEEKTLEKNDFLSCFPIELKISDTCFTLIDNTSLESDRTNIVQLEKKLKSSYVIVQYLRGDITGIALTQTSDEIFLTDEKHSLFKKSLEISHDKIYHNFINLIEKKYDVLVGAGEKSEFYPPVQKNKVSHKTIDSFWIRLKKSINIPDSIFINYKLVGPKTTFSFQTIFFFNLTRPGHA